MVKEETYLVIKVEEMMRTDRYVDEKGEKVVTTMTAFKRQMKEERGINFRTLLKCTREWWNQLFCMALSFGDWKCKRG